ncbi:MAG: hypothetical protein K6A67_11325 [Bacteroidales bacterium]|nr:hypothetical protein [Bacteroidales bacterium]
MKTKSLNDIIEQQKRIVERYLPKNSYPNGSKESKRLCLIYNIVSVAIDNIASVQWERSKNVKSNWSDMNEKFPHSVYANPKPKYSYDPIVNDVLEVTAKFNN